MKNHNKKQKIVNKNLLEKIAPNLVFNMYMKGIHIADREMNLDNGFKSITKPHKNKKKYNRKKNYKQDEYNNI